MVCLERGQGPQPSPLHPPRASVREKKEGTTTSLAFRSLPSPGGNHSFLPVPFPRSGEAGSVRFTTSTNQPTNQPTNKLMMMIAAFHDVDVDHRSSSSSTSSSTSCGADADCRQKSRFPSRDVFLSPDERYAIWCVKVAERPELLLVRQQQPDPGPKQEEDRKPSCSSASSSSTSWSSIAVAPNEDPPPHHRHDDNDDDDNDDNDDNDKDPPEPFVPHSLPLTDGCDLEGWRRHRLLLVGAVAAQVDNGMEEDDPVLSVLQVGAGCTLLRRERQIPCVGQHRLRLWIALRQSLLELPHCDNFPPLPRIQYDPDNKIPSHPWFERDNVPVVIDGCADTWMAMKTCCFDQLVERFGHLEWRFSDTHGETMSLQTYCKYVHNLEGQTDDAPLAVYDSQFALDERHQILNEYTIPQCFDTDLFELLDHYHDDDHDGNKDEPPLVESLRPPFRWILIGPARSGTGLHVDPVGTHAWVTLLQGLKRWVLFPPHTDPHSIGMRTPQIPSVVWFRDWYPRLFRRDNSHHSNHDDDHSRAVHVLQHPGETVYVPAGWPHLVLNLELSVAITHNYATEFPSMTALYTALMDAEPRAAKLFAQRLGLHRPDLYVALPLSAKEERRPGDC